MLVDVYKRQGIACIAAQYFDVPVIFAKKAQSLNLDGEMYCSKVESFTHKKVYDVILSKKFLGPEDHVLLIDDFLANGCALMGLIEIVKAVSYTHLVDYSVPLYGTFYNKKRPLQCLRTVRDEILCPWFHPDCQITGISS